MPSQQRVVHNIPLEHSEVGGELLDILSRGLYADVKDAIREYVQNGVDAKARTITITASGPVLTVHDDGQGMDWDTLRRARRFGLSQKSPILNVGFRGIGIYASFGMCETLTITTRTAGVDDLLHLEMDFGEMRRVLESDLQSQTRSGVALADLFSEYTRFIREPYAGDTSESFTLVQLTGLSEQYRAQMTDLSEMQSYLLNTVPVAFPSRGYGSTISQWLRTQVNLNPVEIILRIGSEPSLKVSPTIAADVGDPESHWLVDGDGRRLAFIWFAMSQTRSRVRNPSGSDEGTGVSGFLLKMKGFTLGDRTTLKPLWPARGGRTLYHHCTGEVHLTESARAYPNAARSDLEPSGDTRTVRRHLTDFFLTLMDRVDARRELSLLADQVSGLDATANSLKSDLNDQNSDNLETYRKARNFLEDLDRLEGRLSRLASGKKAEALSKGELAEARRLRTSVRAARRTATRVADVSDRRHKGKRTKPPAPEQVPPQAAILTRALKALRKMRDSKRTPQLRTAVSEMKEAVSLNLSQPAAVILDTLKAEGTPLSPEAEACRRELRSLIGWSPSAPVSLPEALQNAGVLPASERETAIISGVDRGILEGLGERGTRFETLIESVARAMSEELDETNKA